jgi:UDP-sulfoquinovose synthase
MNPPAAGEFRVFNQFTEQFNVLQLAQTVQGAAGELGIKVDIQHVPNPRTEREQHYYNAKHQKLLDLGLQPHFLSDTLIESVLGEIQRYRDRIRPDTIMPWVKWNATSTPPPKLEAPARAAAPVGSQASR